MGTLKSYAPCGPLKGPPEPQAWWSYKKSGACPIVIERKLKYVVTHLNNLAEAEQLYKEEEAKPELDRHPDALQNLKLRVENRRAWLDYSIQVLRNCLRFALARIEGGSEDNKLLRELRAEAGMPYKNLTGRTNKRKHDKIRGYSKVLDQYLLAKTAVSGTSRANDAMKAVWKICAKAVGVHKHKSGRERDDAQQQAALGILKACKAYEPGENGKFAQLSTFASYKIWRATQARKASHCKPGKTIEGGKTKAVFSISAPTAEDGTDVFHPSATGVDQVLVHDVRSALDSLPDNIRSIAYDGLLMGTKAADIAESEGLTISQVRSRLRKAKAVLAELLVDHKPN